MINKTNRILFIGDSITDVFRDRADATDLGSGFPKLLADFLIEKYPEYHLTFFNRGISGDRVVDLKQRGLKIAWTYSRI